MFSWRLTKKPSAEMKLGFFFPLWSVKVCFLKQLRAEFNPKPKKERKKLACFFALFFPPSKALS